MATRERKRPARKKAPAKKRTTSKITEAQKAARDSLAGQAEADRKKRLAEYAKNQKNPTKLDPRTATPMATRGAGIPQDKIAERDAAKSMSQAAQKIAGLATNLKAERAAAPKQPMANPDLYGKPVKDRVAALNQLMSAQAEQRAKAMASKGQAVYMGAQQNRAKIRNRGPERMDPDTGKTYEVTALGESYLSKAELLSWLSDPVKLDQIKASAEAAGLQVQNVDDVMKLWTSVVNQAADSYSLAGKKVTPWALLKLRGRYSVNGKMPDKVTTTTNIDEMEPEQARLMFEQTAMQALGRAPTKSEVDDFIAKAQTIARSNPTVTKTTQKIGFDGNVTDTTNITTGGGADAKAQVAAMDQARQSEDYASYQAAGNYFPMLFEALRSPV